MKKVADNRAMKMRSMKEIAKYLGGMTKERVLDKNSEWHLRWFLETSGCSEDERYKKLEAAFERVRRGHTEEGSYREDYITTDGKYTIVTEEWQDMNDMLHHSFLVERTEGVKAPSF